MEAHALEGGFADPPVDAAHAFRGVMEAMARPGTIQTVAGSLPPAPLSVAAGTAILTLCDPDTPLYLAGDADCEPVRAWIAFHTGAPLSDAHGCMFAVGGWDDLLPLSAYPVGTSEYPDRSATLIVEMPSLKARGTRLRGPGIKHVAELSLPDPDALRGNAGQFPLGLDFLFTCEDRLAALPRTTEVI